jgi:hypothetical protein
MEKGRKRKKKISGIQGKESKEVSSQLAARREKNA